MHKLLRRYWVLLPALASMATQCDESPRGAVPTTGVSIEVVLTSVSAAIPVDPTGAAAYRSCLQRMETENNVRPGPVTAQLAPLSRDPFPVWQANVRIPLAPDSAVPNVSRATLFFVPVDFINTMTVHDTNECARDPNGDGRVVTGVMINGTVVDRAIGRDGKTLAFQISADGLVTLPPVTPSPLQ